MNKNVYIAGPDIFKKNPIKEYTLIKNILSLRGFNGISPYDTQSLNHKEIYFNNLKLIEISDYVIANLDPFRGPSVDVGTAIEIGYAKAIGKVIVGYYNSLINEYKDRVKDNYIDDKYPTVEDFGIQDNLMVINSCKSICYNLNSAVDLLWLMERSK